MTSASAAVVAGTPRAWIAAIVAAAAALRLVLALQPLDRVDRLFVPDDTYYTLAIARSIAHGLGPTVDGVTLTNGFQPLLAFALTPVYGLAVDDDAVVRICIVLTALTDVLAVWLVVRVTSRSWGPVAGSIAGALWAVSPLAVANALGGLETSLAVGAVLLLVERYGAYTDRPSTAQAVVVGAMGGLAWLARVDTAAAVALVTTAALVRRAPRAHLAAAAMGFGIVVAPWWIYELIRFHSIIPESGAAVRSQVGFHRSLYLTSSLQAAWAAGYLTTAPFAEARAWRQMLFEAQTTGLLVFAAGWIASAAALARAIAARKAIEPAHILCAFGLVVAIFYTCYVPALWFFRRYLAPAEVALAVAWGAALAHLAVANGVRRFAAIAAVTGAVVLGLVQTARWIRFDPASFDIMLEGSKGYREPARIVLASAPPGAVIGAFQSGALSYYAPAGVQIVNLDGVVDGNAHRAILAGRLRDYARQRGVSWFADWPLNRAALDFFSPRATTPPPMLIKGLDGPPRGPDRTTLFAVRWPPAPRP